MQIFWTAGPVTTLGLIGGYYIGYGTMPSLQLLIYFVSFTVFSGVIGLVAKVVYDGTRGHLEEQTERDILTVTDTLGDLILVARDYVVQGYEEDARQREAALQQLERVLKNCIELYEMAYEGYKESAKRRNELIRATEKWEKIITDSGGSPGTVKVGSGRRGIRIKESIFKAFSGLEFKVLRGSLFLRCH
jgi:hypothetical protein